jgi:peptidoglycan glycosyltransferase
MERQITRLSWVFLALFVILLAQVNYLQVFAADDLANNPANRRLLLQEYDVQRGSILARDGKTVLAFSKATGGELKYLRVYPRGPLYGSLTGYYSVVFGRSGVESSFNQYLAGRDESLLPQKLIDEILGRPERGGTVVTTIDPVLQRLAQDQLAARTGAVVAMDPRTGEVLAMFSTPGFDPNPLASHDLEAVREAWQQLNGAAGKPLLPKATQELFPPGSTFKLVTAAAALENGMELDTRIDNPPTYTPPQTTNELHNFGDTHCAGGAAQITLAQAFEESCNVAFAQIGVEFLGADKLVTQAEAFGFNGEVDFDVPFSEGEIPQADVFRDDQPGLAFSAIGQQSVAANPMQMALVAASIANGGVQMRPRLVHEIRDQSGRVVSTFGPDSIAEPISAESARNLTQMMVATVEQGTATAAQLPGIQVAGKTGTAQHGPPGTPPHAWFVSFAPAGDPQIVVAVVVLNGGDLGSEATGGRVAAPIAKALMQAAVDRSGSGEG